MRVFELQLLNLFEVMALAHLLVGALLDDFPTFHHNNLVCVFSVTDSMCYQDACFVF
jgi:hypothetical protein